MLVAKPLTTEVVLQRLTAHPATDVAKALASVVVREPSSLRLFAVIALPFWLSLTVERQQGSWEPYPDTLGVMVTRHY